MEEIKEIDKEKPAKVLKNDDIFSKIFFFGVPFTIPVIVTLVTYLSYPMFSTVIWLPLLLIYWATIWVYTLFYRYKRGGVFDRDRFKLTLKLKGKYLWLQYLLVYGPLVYAIPLFIINYSTKLSIAMYIALFLTSAMNGPTEEIFWRACLEDAGKNAGISQNKRLAFAPIAFALWHTAFVIYIFPWNEFWLISWVGIILMTWTSGFIWMWVMHRSGRLIPQCLYHSCANFLNIFPMILVTVLQTYF
ncbi:MAG: CPBP family intramembrane glutamic endopeptidase [Promethearchaeota archaeon]